MRRVIAVTAAVLLSAARLASAQPATRGGDTQDAARAENARTPSSPAPSRLERVLITIERRGLINNLPEPHDGLALRIGSLDEGNRLAIGPLWRYSRLANSQVVVDASAAVSLENDREIAAGLHLPRIWRERLSVGWTASATELPEGHFYGLGNDSQRSHQNAFELGRRAIRTGVTFSPAAPLVVEASTGLLSAHLRNLGGLDVAGADFNFLRSRVAITFDDRDRPANPRRGGRYQVSLERFAGPEDEWTSFNRLNTEFEQHLAASPKQTVTLRFIASLSNADEGHDVPFYLMPTLGGSRLLRGFEHERFRDRHHVVLQGEYGWDLSKTLGAVLFYERGAVAPRISDFKLSTMHSDYGVGLRVGSPRFVALRTDVAFGSGEGMRVVLRFHHGL